MHTVVNEPNWNAVAHGPVAALQEWDGKVLCSYMSSLITSRYTCLQRCIYLFYTVASWRGGMLMEGTVPYVDSILEGEEVLL